VDFPVNCAEYWGASFSGELKTQFINLLIGNTILFGTDEGLFAYDTDDKEAKMTPVSNRRYTQLTVIEELGILLSVSGKFSYTRSLCRF
jgi:hypothetical protein